MNPFRHIEWPGIRRRHVCLVLAGTVTIAACTSAVETERTNDEADSSAPPTSPLESVSTPPPATTSVTATTTTVPAATTAAPTTTAPVSTTSPSTTTPTTTTTVPLDVFDPDCVVRAAAATTFEQIGIESDIEDPVALWFENGQVDTVAAGDLIDVCPANSLNDIDGGPNPVFDDAAISVALSANVERQQTKLNELFAGFGTGELAVDGASGPLTGQRLCAARLSLGLDTTIADMMPGSVEQAALFASDSLPTPNSTAIESQRWVLIDRTCQIMFIGAGDDTVFVFPTSTGSEGFETRDQDRAEAFRFNPALDNGGWHDSTEFPVGVDNPLNGNLYKPLYFDTGQAIHGANNVPPTPQSKGCARLRVNDQNTFVGWLGLDDATGETWRKDEMNVTVNVQGEFVPRT